MAYCLNCNYAHNPEQHRYCHQCGALLTLRGRFNILHQIGQGGFGRTYLAEDLDNRKKRCVVKQLAYRGGGTHADDEAHRLFEQEAERLDQLNHPQIPHLLAYFEHGGYLYLVQEFIEGHDLQQELVDQGAFSEAKIWEILRELLPTLQFIHEHKVIHRDLKPDNVMRRGSDRKLILIDFGVAKFLAKSALNMGGTVVGTLGYAAPEQMMGRVSPASDLYSLGMICFYLLTATDIYQLFRDYDYGWVNNWQQYLNVPISQRLTHVLDKLLKLDGCDRYMTAEEVLSDLDGPKARGRRTVARGPLTRRQADVAKTSLQRQMPWFLPSKLKLLISVGVLGGLSVSLWFILQSTNQPRVSFERTFQIVVESPLQEPVESFAQVVQVPEGIFNYGGSTTWSPIRDLVDVEIQTARPEFRLRYVLPEGVPPSSQSGLDMLAEGKVEFSLASRLPSTELIDELEANGLKIRLVPVAENFDVAAVNRSLPVDQLTIDELNAILEGRVRNWRDVGGPDLAIIRFDRNVNDNFMATRPNQESDNIEFFTTPSEAVRNASEFPGGIYVHTAAMLIPQCSMKTLAIVNGAGETVIPYREPLVPADQCLIQKNRVNLAELGSGKYPRQLSDKLYVVINQNGGHEQQVGEAYANFLRSDEGQTLLEKAGYLGIQR